MKKIICIALSVLIFTALGVQAFADSNGFVDSGSYSGSKVSFGFETLDTVLVYNNELYEYPDFDDIWPGSDIYIPVCILSEDGSQIEIATDKDIKDSAVSLSYKAVIGDKYIDSVELADGKKAKIPGLQSGIHAKIQVSESYTGNGVTPVDIKLVLSVRRISYPETQIELYMDISNRLVIIGEDTVYPAQSPTHFRALRGYSGSATFDFGNNIKYATRVSKGTSYYLNLDRADQPPVKLKYPEAFLEFYNFLGDKDSFEAGGTLEIPINRANFTPKNAANAQVYVYEIAGDALVTLDESTISFDGKKNLLSIKASVLGNYVISSEPLLKELDDETDAILYTGYASSSAAEPSAPGAGAASSEPLYTAQQQSAPQSSASPDTLPNNNVNTGLDIQANNASASNPQTSDISLAPAITLLFASGALITVFTQKSFIMPF